MFDEEKAKTLVSQAFPGIEIEDCFKYKDLYLVRIKHEDPEESDFDPFLSVDLKTGSVNEFSVMTDGDLVEIAEAYAQSRQRR